MTATTDAFAHNVQRGRIEKNRFKFCLFLTADPSDDYLTVHDCPARKFDGRTFERSNDAYLCEASDDLPGEMPMTFGGGVEIRLVTGGVPDDLFERGYQDFLNHRKTLAAAYAESAFGANTTYGVYVGDTCLGTYDYYLQASRAARAIAGYARAHRVETSRLS